LNGLLDRFESFINIFIYIFLFNVFLFNVYYVILFLHRNCLCFFCFIFIIWLFLYLRFFTFLLFLFLSFSRRLWIFIVSLYFRFRLSFIITSCFLVVWVIFYQFFLKDTLLFCLRRIKNYFWIIQICIQTSSAIIYSKFCVFNCYCLARLDLDEICSSSPKSDRYSIPRLIFQSCF
jgi:hypothetical protein